jgi:hypothetical protein
VVSDGLSEAKPIEALFRRRDGLRKSLTHQAIALGAAIRD